MADLEHEKYTTPPRIVKREVILSDTEKYISDNWRLLERAEKDTFKKLLGKAFDYVLCKIDSRLGKEESKNNNE